MMMKVGLEMSDGSIPRPIAIPRARIVFPVPSSPDRAKTSFGRAARPRRSPSRSVCKEEWLTRSSETTSFRRSATDDSAAEPPALEEQPDGDAEERSEERGPDREPPLLGHLTEKLHAHATPESATQWDEGERADEGAPPAKGSLILLERVSSPFVRALLARLGLRGTMLGRISPVAAPSTSCHGGRLPLGGAAVVRARGELLVGLRRLLVSAFAFIGV